MNILDIFAGAGGLSEGFVNAGYKVVAHVEKDTAACNTLKTRESYRLLSEVGKKDLYRQYLRGELTRSSLYGSASKIREPNVLNENISVGTLPRLLTKLDTLCGGRDIDILVGGPPCQAYSIASRTRRSGTNSNDIRNYLFETYATILAHYKPKAFIFENVIGLLSAKDHRGHSYLERMLSLFESCGYSCEILKVNAADYGVLQSRKRLIIIGIDRSLNLKFGNLTTVKHLYNVNDALYGLPKISANGGAYHGWFTLDKANEWMNKYNIASSFDVITGHNARPNRIQDLIIYRHVVESWNLHRRRVNYSDLRDDLKSHSNHETFTDRFKVVAGDLPFSQTVVAHIAKDGHYYIHPDLDQNRSLTPREAARLQSFPDDYHFESVSGGPARTPAYRQIGNAVPVQLAKRIALKLKQVLS